MFGGRPGRRLSSGQPLNLVAYCVAYCLVVTAGKRNTYFFIVALQLAC